MTPGDPIEFAHVRRGTGGGMGMKPSDRHGISLCRTCHARQHLIGEAAFEAETGLDLRAMADAYARKSPHWSKLKEMN
uniref:hypothetical protein n=1 Tax=Edaphosphingomonas laterariae TaxID=861865 RepID=UPI000B77A91F|nr:hypothetical protein [Sphingomonas laterariae]